MRSNVYKWLIVTLIEQKLKCELIDFGARVRMTLKFMGWITRFEIIQIDLKKGRKHYDLWSLLTIFFGWVVLDMIFQWDIRFFVGTFFIRFFLIFLIFFFVGFFIISNLSSSKIRCVNNKFSLHTIQKSLHITIVNAREKKQQNEVNRVVI